MNAKYEKKIRLCFIIETIRFYSVKNAIIRGRITTKMKDNFSFTPSLPEWFTKELEIYYEKITPLNRYYYLLKKVKFRKEHFFCIN